MGAVYGHPTDTLGCTSFLADRPTRRAASKSAGRIAANAERGALLVPREAGIARGLRSKGGAVEERVSPNALRAAPLNPLGTAQAMAMEVVTARGRSRGRSARGSARGRRTASTRRTGC
jgi:hypothetical protein